MTFVKSTSPKKMATIYPPIIPNRNGMIFKKPFAFVLMNAVMRNVTTATNIAFQSPSFTNPAFVTALLARPRFSSTGFYGKLIKDRDKIYFKYNEENAHNAKGQHIVFFYDNFVVGGGEIK